MAKFAQMPLLLPVRSGPGNSNPGTGTTVLRRALLANLLLLCSTFLHAGELFTAKELWATGQLWVRTRIQWKDELDLHKQRMGEINASTMPESRKDYFRQRELARHKAESDILAGKRHQIQNVLIDESNARVRSGKHENSTLLTDTAGTKFGEKGHRGMAGDRDMGGGERTIQKIKEVLKEMGISGGYTKVTETAGTLEIGGDFELTINKTGMQPKAGTDMHRVKVDVDAHNPETYVSEGMKVRNEDGKLVKQVGTDYVEVQDHRKKAAKGLASDGDGLVRSPDKMRSMAKGTKKTLEMGQVDNETLAKILKKNGLQQTPAEFKQQLEGLKESNLSIDDSLQAERMRRASEDIFSAAEQKTLMQAKKDLVDLRKKAAGLPDGHPSKQIIEDEILDTVAKMKSTKAANEDLINGRVSTDAPGGTKPATAAGEGMGSKALKAFGVAMVISDIGQSCEVIERYVDGQIPLTEAATEIVDQHVLGGVVGTAKHAKESYDDHQETRKTIQEANWQNMTAFLTQYELQFRRAGMSAQEARRAVGRAILSGKLEVLQQTASQLRAQGKDIEEPQLVVETYQADDTPGQRTVNVVTGFVEGVGKGGMYILSAPSRVLEAWGQGELNEAELEAYADTITADSRKAIFKKLVGAGFEPRAVLDALANHEAGKPAKLKALFAKARAQRLAAQPTPEELAAAERARALADAAKRKREAALEQYERHVNYLRWAPLKLTYDPLPLEIPAEGQSRLVTLQLLAGSDNRLPQVVHQLEGILGQLTGAPTTVTLRYSFSCRGKQGENPHIWLTASPKSAGVYPVTAKLTVEIAGAGLVEPYDVLKKTFEREAFVSVDVSVNPEMNLQGEVWAVLRRAPNLSISRDVFNHDARVTIGRQITFSTTNVLKHSGSRVESRVRVRMAPDARSVEELFVESESYRLDDGKLADTERLTVRNFKLAELIPETDTQAASAIFLLEGDGKGHFGTIQVGGPDGEGRLRWGEVQTVGINTTSFYKPGISFHMDKKDSDEKFKKEQAARNTRKQQEQETTTKAAKGETYEGAIGKAEGLDGSITLKISLAEKVVAGEFRAQRVTNENTKDMVDGKILGTIDPESGAIQAKLTQSAIYTMKKQKDGSWFIAGGYTAIQSFDQETRVVGKLDGATATGSFRLNNRDGFQWTATLKKEAKR